MSLILPMAIVLFADWQIAMFPWLTIGASMIFIPLATVIVIRAALSELDLLIAEVAPFESNPNDLRDTK